MRKIGTIPSAPLAERFHNYLNGSGIQNRVDAVDGVWEVWIYDEEKVPTGQEELQSFLTSPEEARFKVVPKEAAKAPPVKPVRREIKFQGAERPTVTMIVTILIVTVSFATNFGEDTARANELLFSPSGRDLTPIMEGQFWRLITPIFMHASLLHLAFNGYMFWMLGGAIERLKGSRTLLLLILSIAVFSNIVQFAVAGGAFCGLSGVVYGLFGYMWMRSKLLPEDGFYMPPDLVVQLVVWAFICLMLDQIANGAHFGGLALGMLIGAAPRLWRR